MGIHTFHSSFETDESLAQDLGHERAQERLRRGAKRERDRQRERWTLSHYLRKEDEAVERGIHEDAYYEQHQGRVYRKSHPYKKIRPDLIPYRLKPGYSRAEDDRVRNEQSEFPLRSVKPDEERSRNVPDETVAAYTKTLEALGVAIDEGLIRTLIQHQVPATLAAEWLWFVPEGKKDADIVRGLLQADMRDVFVGQEMAQEVTRTQLLFIMSLPDQDELTAKKACLNATDLDEDRAETIYDLNAFLEGSDFPEHPTHRKQMLKWMEDAWGIDIHETAKSHQISKGYVTRILGGYSPENKSGQYGKLIGAIREKARYRIDDLLTGINMSRESYQKWRQSLLDDDLQFSKYVYTLDQPSIDEEIQAQHQKGNVAVAVRLPGVPYRAIFTRKRTTEEPSESSFFARATAKKRQKIKNPTEEVFCTIVTRQAFFQELQRRLGRKWSQDQVMTIFDLLLDEGELFKAASKATKKKILKKLVRMTGMKHTDVARKTEAYHLRMEDQEIQVYADDLKRVLSNDPSLPESLRHWIIESMAHNIAWKIVNHLRFSKLAAA